MKSKKDQINIFSFEDKSSARCLMLATVTMPWGSPVLDEPEEALRAHLWEAWLNTPEDPEVLIVHTATPKIPHFFLPLFIQHGLTFSPNSYLLFLEFLELK